ncbi:MAG: phosphoribosylamine--glycine ligase, partial [Syntrophomonadaceae bacterium]|nr:phosphoribosylamine--glycine ligase [Syntrophomonadaceae bacterium]
LPIEGLRDLSDDILVFHAGTRWQDSQLVTDGGRVLGVVSRAATIRQAVERVYAEIPKIRFEGMHYRRDIARRALER